MSDQFDKVLDLAQKLTSPMVVYDKQGGKHLVILGIDEFAQYLDSGKKPPIEPKPPVNTSSSQAPEIKAQSGMDESIFEPQTEVQESRVEENEDLPVNNTKVDVLPPELEPNEEVPEVNQEIQEIESEIKRNPNPLTPSAATTSQHWHRLGDVIRRVHPEIPLENIPKPVPYQAHPEPVLEVDEPNFLEEPAV